VPNGLVGVLEEFILPFEEFSPEIFALNRIHERLFAFGPISVG
jgi:hypothetical protein